MSFLFKIIFKDFYRYIRTKAGRIFLKLCVLLGTKPRNRDIHLTIENLNFNIPDGLSFLWQFHDIFYQQHYAFTTETSSPLIVDCGANVGLSVFYFKKHYPESKVYAFEADPKVFEYLKRNISPPFKDVNLINKAVWVSDEALSFNSLGSDTGSLDVKGKDKVEGCDLSAFLDQFSSIDMLKIDIEGAEIEVFPHIQKQLNKVKNLFLEYPSSALNAQRLSQLLNILEEAGLRYHIKHEYDRKEPLKFIKSNKNEGFDMQLGIFASRR